MRPITCMKADVCWRHTRIGTPFVFDAAQCQAIRAWLWIARLFRKTWDHYRARLA